MRSAFSNLVLVLVALRVVKAPTPPADEPSLIVTAPILRLPPLEGENIGPLPSRAQEFVVVPKAHTLLAKFDFSLPAMYRLGIERYDPQEHTRILQQMYHYHSEELNNARVPRPMEPNFPRIINLQTEEEEWGPYRRRAFEAQERMRQNAWLLSGKEIIMLNNVQHRMRSLTTQNLISTSEDPIEAKVLRSRLDSSLRTAHRNPRNTKTFADVLREALETVRAEQAEYLDYRRDRQNHQGLWNAEFPFLAHSEVDMTHYLLRY